MSYVQFKNSEQRIYCGAIDPEAFTNLQGIPAAARPHVA